MKNRSIGITFDFCQKYFPTKRHRATRSRRMTTCRDITFRETSNRREFPLALIVTDYTSIYFGAKSYEEIAERASRRDDPNYRYTLNNEEIRYYDGRFYKPRRISYGAAISDQFAPIEDAIDGIRRAGNRDSYYDSPDMPFVEGESIVVEDNLAEKVAMLQDLADNYIFFDGKIWEECGEPMYNITTFGLGHNHGGTGLFISYNYNPNIPARNYFRADQFPEAVAYANKVAAGRGDTNDVGKFDDGRCINVLRPEFLTRNPAKDHAEGGDPFIESIESMINVTNSATEAGIIAMAMTAKAMAS